MCGACGSGAPRAPWETRTHGASRRHLAARAAQAQRLVGERAVVVPFGPAGYTVRTRTGATTVHRDLDDLLTRLLALVPDRVVRQAARPGPDFLVARALLERLPG